METLGAAFAFGPDNGGAVWVLGRAGHGQTRERTFRQEMFERHAVMRLFMRDGRDDAVLIIGILVRPIRA